MDELQELLAVFRRETAEQLDTLGAVFESLRDCPQDELDENIDVAMRTAHNLKGNALCVGEEDLADTSHLLEDALTPFRGSGERPGSHLQDRCFELLDTLRHQADRIGDGVALVQQEETPRIQTDTQSGSIRVDTDRLDDLMTRSNELLFLQARMEAQLRQWKAHGRALDELLDAPNPSREALVERRDAFKELLHAERTQVQQLGYIASDVTQSMKRVRMQPLGRIVPFWRQTVQQSAQFLERQVSFSAEVGEIEIDRYLVEHLQDAMLHLLRNAVDHGIEEEAAREAAGKDPRGRVEVRAVQKGSMIQIDVSDDGQGIDPQDIIAAAIEKGVIEQRQAAGMDDDAKREILFHPAFSTAREVSQISGRGFGLNVVRQNVVRLGGRVEIASRPRLGGTTFELQLPLSLLSTVGLLIRAGGEVYALPTDDIKRVVALEPGQIQRQRDESVAKLTDGTAIPLVWLTSLMGRPAEEIPNGSQLVVVLSRGTQRLGLAVEKIIAEREYVAEGLPWNLVQIPGINGTIVLPDSRVALCLDVASLLELPRGSAALAPPPAGAPERDGTANRVLVVDDALTHRVLERNFLTAAGYDVEVAPDGQAAWALLQSQQFDLVVSDVQMPNMDGLELTRHIRSSERLKHLPVILVTQLAGPKDKDRGHEAGANEYLVKGQLDQRVLLEAVSRIL